MAEIELFATVEQRRQGGIARIHLLWREHSRLRRFRILLQTANHAAFSQMVEVLKDGLCGLHMDGILQSAGRNASPDVPKEISGQMLDGGGIGEVVANDNVAIDDVVEQFDQNLPVPAFDMCRESPRAKIFVN